MYHYKLVQLTFFFTELKLHSCPVLEICYRSEGCLPPPAYYVTSWGSSCGAHSSTILHLKNSTAMSLFRIMTWYFKIIYIVCRQGTNTRFRTVPRSRVLTGDLQYMFTHVLVEGETRDPRENPPMHGKSMQNFAHICPAPAGNQTQDPLAVRQQCYPLSNCAPSTMVRQQSNSKMSKGWCERDGVPLW